MKEQSLLKLRNGDITSFKIRSKKLNEFVMFDGEMVYTSEHCFFGIKVISFLGKIDSENNISLYIHELEKFQEDNLEYIKPLVKYTEFRIQQDSKNFF
jgi:thymidine kinase